MNTTDPKIAALLFNDCINRRDIDELSDRMSDDYTFIDTADTIRTGKEQGIKDWTAFFKMFPDYKNVFEDFIVHDNKVIITGYSTCSDKALSGPALWSAIITRGKISEWRVYEDTPENRSSLGI